jgi:hypothetical protein
MGNLATSEIQGFLQRLGERYSHPATLYLLGGGALCFLGNPRRTREQLENQPDEEEYDRAKWEVLSKRWE